ncbi:MAG TPA: hypothetical protein VJ600_04775 [Holophagaceae bacterium]|nr:hypothetical protein [Holophagaceae bacterium]
MSSVRLSLVLLLAAPLSAAAPSATAHVQVGAAILRPLGFATPSTLALPSQGVRPLSGADLRLGPSFADGSTVVVSTSSADGEARVEGTLDRRDARLLHLELPSSPRSGSPSAVKVMLVYN